MLEYGFNGMLFGFALSMCAIFSNMNEASIAWIFGIGLGIIFSHILMIMNVK